MKKLILLTFFTFFAVASNAQYRWEVSGGATSSKINLENVETSSGTGFYINAGYGYLMGVRAKTSLVFSIELLQKSSELNYNFQSGSGSGPELRVKRDFKVFQVGFSPKFRYLFNSGKDRFRPFINVGPTLRVNLSVEEAGVELEKESYEQLIIGGVYGAGFSQMIGEMFDVFFEVGVMNDFTDNIVDTDSKFFDIYGRIGVRFRIYDARR